MSSKSFRGPGLKGQHTQTGLELHVYELVKSEMSPGYLILVSPFLFQFNDE